MHLKGTLVEWNDDRGFGFIEPVDGGSRVFCYVKAFEVRVRRPIAGDRVTYELAKGTNGRTSAARVRPVGLEDASYQSSIGPKFKKERGRVDESRSGKSWTLRLVLVAVLFTAGASYYAFTHQSQFRTTPNETVVEAQPTTSDQSDAALQRAFAQQLSNVQVQDEGVVERVLPDDSDGSRHQRFIVRLSSGQTVLIAHNIDLAPRISPLTVGDRVEFNGEYEWNNKGGTVHWTHRDPKGRHQAGWIKHDGRMFQ